MKRKMRLSAKAQLPIKKGGQASSPVEGKKNCVALRKKRGVRSPPFKSQGDKRRVRASHGRKGRGEEKRRDPRGKKKY